MARRGGRGGRRRDGGKERFWRRLLREWRRSGRTIRDFCAARHVSEPSFYAWRRIIGARDGQTARGQGGVRLRASVARDEGVAGNGPDNGGAAQPVFVPLRVRPAAAELVSRSVGSMAFEVELGRGRVVRVPAGFDVATLRQLLAVLEEGPSC